jgi:hypothetical protein
VYLQDLLGDFIFSSEQTKVKDSRQNGTKPAPSYGTGALTSLQGLPALNQKSPRRS